MFRYRQLTNNLRDPSRVGGDMTFGRGINNFLADSPTAVAQAVLTRLCLWQGEWFLDTTIGMPWLQQVLGKSVAISGNVPDSAIRTIILNTPFVVRIEDYASSFDHSSRNFTVGCKVTTAFGPITQPPFGTTINPNGRLMFQLESLQQSSLPPLIEPQRQLPPPQLRLSPPRPFG